jgi:hypothetical protein
VTASHRSASAIDEAEKVTYAKDASAASPSEMAPAAGHQQVSEPMDAADATSASPEGEIGSVNTGQDEPD